MLDKLMAYLHAGFDKFFTWWGDLTGLGTKTYFNGKLVVNWKVISVPIILIILMVVFLPGGLLF